MVIRATRGFASSYPRGGTLVSWLAEYVDFAVAIRAAAVLFVTVLTATAAQVSLPLPFRPVPFTFQPMIVCLGCGGCLVSAITCREPRDTDS